MTYTAKSKLSGSDYKKNPVGIYIYEFITLLFLQFMLSQQNLLSTTSLPLLPTDKYQHQSHWGHYDLLVGTMVVAVTNKLIVNQSPLQGF